MGRALRVVGPVLMVGGVLLALGLRFIEEPPALGFLPMALLVLGAMAFYQGRRSASRLEAPADLRTPGPRVLYLRPARAGLDPKEERLAEIFRPVGRLVAIGRPNGPAAGEDVTTVRTDDAGWRSTVDGQLRVARLVIIRIGSGDGLRWELRRARQLVAPTRLMLFSCRLDRAQFRCVIEDVELAVGVVLPAPDGPGPFHRRIGFYRFSGDWQPQFLPILPSLSRAGSTVALQPVFEQLGVPCEVRRLS